MKSVRYSVMAVMVVGLLVWNQAGPARAGWNDVISGAKNALETAGDSSKAAAPGQDLSEDTIVRGLKEALVTGTGKAVALVGTADGYLGNPSIRIPLPEKVQKAEKILRSVGLGSTLDEFETSMNRAAEKAAPEAGKIFQDAVKDMSITDARSILGGQDNAATEYFRGKTEGKLGEMFKPIVHSTMSQVGATRTYQDLSARAQAVPLVGSMGLDLDDYVTGKAMNGLFLMLAQEEQKIRKDPVARGTELLKTVFGSR
ncbi:MAG: DUF4197 domain-containing protein [Pseudomonadota bacterium]